MAAIDDYLDRIPNEELRNQLRIEVARLTKKKKFGLVYENHLPDNVVMPEVTIRPVFPSGKCISRELTTSPENYVSFLSLHSNGYEGKVYVGMMFSFQYLFMCIQSALNTLYKIAKLLEVDKRDLLNLLPITNFL